MEILNGSRLIRFSRLNTILTQSLKQQLKIEREKEREEGVCFLPAAAVRPLTAERSLLLTVCVTARCGVENPTPVEKRTFNNIEFLIFPSLNFREKKIIFFWALSSDIFRP